MHSSDLMQDSNIKDVAHLVISVVTYDDGERFLNVYDVESSRSMTVEEAIGILETAKYSLLESGFTHVLQMGEIES